MIRRLLVLLLFTIPTILVHAEDVQAGSCEPLENQIKTDTGNVGLRQKLIDCYFSAELRSPSHRAEIEKVRAAQVLWLVQHAPETTAAGSPQTNIAYYSYPEDYAEIKTAWMRQAAEHGDNAQVLTHAAQFLRNPEDLPKAEELATRAHILDAGNADVALMLAQLYHLEAISKPDMAAQLAGQALQLREATLGSLSPAQKLQQLQAMAEDAFDSGDNAKARRYAEQLLALAQQEKQTKPGDAIHHGNLVLGRLAMHEGNVAEAKTRLLAAGKTPGSPVLGSFGPNMVLAKELLEAHQTEAVLRYFDECAQFWKGHENTLDQWRATVHRGQIPDFGANLVY